MALPGVCARQRQTTAIRQTIGIMGNYGELWGIMGNYGELWGIMRNCGGIMGNYGELWGIMGNLGGIMGNYGELWGNCGLVFILDVLLFVPDCLLLIRGVLPSCW